MPTLPPAAAMMKAARLHGPRDLRCEDVPHPGPPPEGHVLIRVEAVGVCGSDLHTYEHGRIGDTSVESPLILGHEFAGVIEEVGEAAVTEEGRPLRKGDRVAVDPAWPCGKCEPCRMGHPNLCIDHAFAGVYPTDGALRRFMHVPASACFVVPEAVTAEDAAMLEPLGVGLHAVDLGHIRVGHSVLVVGAGPIGLFVAECARLAGARPVLVSDRLPHRLELAKRGGAETIHIDEADPVHAVHRATGGRGVDVAFEVAWSNEDSVAQAAEALRPGGRLVIVGISGDDRLTFQHSTVRRKGLTIAMCRRMKHTYPRAIDLATRGDIDLRSMITHRFALHQANEALDLALSHDNGVGKVMVRLHE
ncbi:MAG: zinc-dependent alcohol dehydrogenase [Phycisphaeraceae bacterium]